MPSFWGVDVLRLLGAPGAGVFSHALFNILVTTLVAYVAWQLAETALDRSLAAHAPRRSPTPSARARTLKPLLRKFMLAVLVVVWVMIALSAVGIDIGPLLAGAGVVGIALGFGAQTLVRDVVSGVFFLLDDAFRVGEYIEAGSLKGTVEGISIRSLRVRHHRGALHTIPYGELTSLTNHSRDWVIVKLEILVTYDTDVDQVKAIIKQIGKEMLEGPGARAEPDRAFEVAGHSSAGRPRRDGARQVHGQARRAVRDQARGAAADQTRVRCGRHQVCVPDRHDQSSSVALAPARRRAGSGGQDGHQGAGE